MHSEVERLLREFRDSVRYVRSRGEKEDLAKRAEEMLGIDSKTLPISYYDEQEAKAPPPEPRSVWDRLKPV
jgi:hypothetical protein